MIGVYDYTVILTFLSLLSASTGIITTLSGSGHPYIGSFFLLFCGLCDAFDGKIAHRKVDRTDISRRFGIQIDSLSDLVAFGVLPACIGTALIRVSPFMHRIQEAFGDIPWLAIALSLMFYILLALAALTSTISLHEVVTAYLHEEFKFTRKKAARLVTAGCIILGVLCSLSLGVGKNYTIFGLNLFDLFDFLTAKIMLPLGGLFISIFTGWYLDKKIVWEEVSNNGTLNIHIYKLLIFILKFIAPIGIALIFINELGFLK